MLGDQLPAVVVGRVDVGVGALEERDVGLVPVPVAVVPERLARRAASACRAPGPAPPARPAGTLAPSTTIAARSRCNTSAPNGFSSHVLPSSLLARRSPPARQTLYAPLGPAQTRPDCGIRRSCQTCPSGEAYRKPPPPTASACWSTGSAARRDQREGSRDKWLKELVPQPSAAGMARARPGRWKQFVQLVLEGTGRQEEAMSTSCAQSPPWHRHAHYARVT